MRLAAQAARQRVDGWRRAGKHPAVTVSLPVDPTAPAPHARIDWRAQLKRWTPLLALALGIVSQIFARHTVTFAPKALAFVVVAWVLAAGLGA